MTVSNSSDRLLVPDEDTEEAASAKVIEDEAAGVRTLYLICARIAKQRRLSSDARKALERAVFRAVSEGAIASIARESEVPDLVFDGRGTTSVAIGFDTVVNEHDVIAWLDAQRRAVYKTTPRRSSLVPVGEKVSTKPAAPLLNRPKSPGDTPTSAATAARWGAHPSFKDEAFAKVIEQHKLTPFTSRADAARWIAENVPKVDGGTEFFKFDTCDNWLKGSGWTAKLSCDEWIALYPGDSPPTSKDEDHAH